MEESIARKDHFNFIGFKQEFLILLDLNRKGLTVNILPGMTLDQLERCVLEFCISEVQRGLIWIETALHRERQLRSSWILCYFLDLWNTTNGFTCTVGLRVMFPQRSKQRLPGAVSTQENGACVGRFSSYVLQTQFKLGPCVPGN